VDWLGDVGVKGWGASITAVDRLSGVASRAVDDGAVKTTGRRPAVASGSWCRGRTAWRGAWPGWRQR
jgi:hypothetical protein